jgi:hypothetical protein
VHIDALFRSGVALINAGINIAGISAIAELLFFLQNARLQKRFNPG